MLVSFCINCNFHVSLFCIIQLFLLLLLFNHQIATMYIQNCFQHSSLVLIFLILIFIPRVLGSACLVKCRLFIPCPCIGLPPLCSSRFLHIVFTLVSHCWLRFCVSLSVYVCVYGYRLFVSRVRSMENVIVFCLFRNVKFHNFAIFDKIAACSLLLFPLLFYGTNEERKC